MTEILAPSSTVPPLPHPNPGPELKGLLIQYQG